MAFRYVKNIWSTLRQTADRDVWHVADAGAPVNGTSGTGVGMLGPGSIYSNTTTGKIYVNVGTKASPTWETVTSA
jgi:hypothetical protein